MTLVRSVSVCFTLLLAAGCGSDGSSSSVPREGGATVAGLPSCDTVCPAIVAAKCPGGPVSQSDCVGGCQTIEGGKCASLYKAVYECGGSSPKYACASDGSVTVSGCETQMSALYACVSSP